MSDVTPRRAPWSRLIARRAGLCCMLLAAGAAIAHDGDLDPSFGRASYRPGTVVLGALRYDHDTATALAIQHDGKIIVGGNSEREVGSASTLAVVRLFPDGTQDMSFAAGSETPGAFIYPYAGTGSRLDAIALDSQGRIVIGGTVATTQGIDGAIWRLRTDGTLDTGFGVGGVSLFEVNDDVAHATVVYDLKLNASDTIYVTGTYNGSGHSQYMLGVFTPDGSKVHVEVGDFGPGTPYDVVPTRLIVQADGKLVVGGYWAFMTQWLCMDARFDVTLDAGGFHFPLDTSYAHGFGRNGLAYGLTGPGGEQFADCFNDAIIQLANGGYFTAGRVSYHSPDDGWMAQRYDLDASGSLSNSQVFRLSPYGDNSVRALLEQRNHAVVMAGFTGYDDGQGDTGSGFASVRRSADFVSLDPSWGSNGVSFIKFDAINSSNDQAFAAAFDADQRTVMVGSSFGGIQSPSNKRFAIARLQSDLIFRNAFEPHE